MELTAIPAKEFDLQGYEAYLTYDPEGYDWSDWDEDPYPTGWFHFCETVIADAIKALGDLEGIWDAYDAGSRFTGTFESVAKLADALEKVQDQYGGFEIIACYLDFTCELTLEGELLSRFYIEGEDGFPEPAKQVSICVQTNIYREGETIVWITPSNLIFLTVEILMILLAYFPDHGFEMSPDWMVGDNCVGNRIKVCDRETSEDFIAQGTNRPTNHKLAYELAEACGLEVIVP